MTGVYFFIKTCQKYCILNIVCRLFDKDEDGKLSVEELREVMITMGEGPLQEKEFNNFIKVRSDVI